MYPIALDLTKVPIFLTGEGEAFEKRKRQLTEHGATKLVCHMEEAAVVMVAGLDSSVSGIIAGDARAAGKLVNVEDVPELCDFYFTSYVRRGDLLIAVSTNGASPTLAKRVREKIAGLFGEEWANHTRVMKELRERLRGEGKSMQEVMAASDAFLDEKGWLKS